MLHGVDFMQGQKYARLRNFRNFSIWKIYITNNGKKKKKLVIGSPIASSPGTITIFETLFLTLHFLFPNTFKLWCLFVFCVSWPFVILFVSCTDFSYIAYYALISIGAVLFAVGVIIAIYCKIKCQGKSNFFY